MDPISNADRLVLLLRQKLEERAKAAAGARPGGKAKSGTSVPAEPSGILALAGVDGADERTLRRAMVQNLLADQLGPALINDAQFQQVVSRVTDAMESDTAVARLLTQVIADLRAG